jgi:hypothetical protein
MRLTPLEQNGHRQSKGSPVSPTTPTFATLNNQLNEAHHRIRELEAREAELCAQISTLGASFTPRRTDDRELSPIAVQRWESDGGAELKRRDRRS